MSLVIKKEFILKSLNYLRNQTIHPLFVGYLHLQRRSGELDRLIDLQPDFLSYYKEFFYIEGHPLGTPYIRVFTDKPASQSNLWLNANVAGSYAPSSLRPNQPFRKVIKIESKTYSLPDDHAAAAYKNLMYENKIDPFYFAAFIYRDFCFNKEDLSVSDLVDVFRQDFGYTNEQHSRSNFEQIFKMDTKPLDSSEWLEEY